MKNKTTFPPEMRIKFDTERDSNMNFLGLLNPDLRDQKVGMGIKKDATYMILESKTKFDENISKVKFNLVPEIIFEKSVAETTENILNKLGENSKKIKIKIFNKSKYLVSLTIFSNYLFFLFTKNIIIFIKEKFTQNQFCSINYIIADFHCYLNCINLSV